MKFKSFDILKLFFFVENLLELRDINYILFFFILIYNGVKDCFRN